MTGRVMIVTGGSSGIGYEVVRYLAEGGNDIILASRDREKGEDAVWRIKRDLPNCLVRYMELDLSSTTSVREFVKEFTKRKRKLNVLINNAAMAPNYKDTTRNTTSEGMELTMATNHLGPLLLTNLLLDYMIHTSSIMGEGRIINVTCSIHDHENNWSTRGLAFLQADNFQLQKEGTYTGLQAYKNSKLCNLLSSYYLADKLKGTCNVTVNAIDPGVVRDTDLYRHADKVQRTFSFCCLHNALWPCKHQTARQAAAYIGQLAISEKYEEKTGKFFRNGVEDRSSVESYDRDLQKDIWRKGCRLVNIRSLMMEDGFDDISLSSNKGELQGGGQN